MGGGLGCFCEVSGGFALVELLGEIFVFQACLLTNVDKCQQMVYSGWEISFLDWRYVMTQVRVDEDTMERLRSLAEMDHRKLTQMITVLVDEEWDRRVTQPNPDVMLDQVMGEVVKSEEV